MHKFAVVLPFCQHVAQHSLLFGPPHGVPLQIDLPSTALCELLTGFALRALPPTRSLRLQSPPPDNPSQALPLPFTYRFEL